MKKESTLDYIIIGAHKAGTTWVSDMFKQLPDFSKIPIKELHYFDLDQNYDDVKPLGNILFWKRITNRKWLFHSSKLIAKCFTEQEITVSLMLHFIFKKYDDDWYLKFFRYFKKIKGDITPSYSRLLEKDVKRMSDICSDKTKIIFILRDPIERSWSNFTHALTKGLYKNADEKEINEILESKFVSDRSNYLMTISNYRKYFPDNQFKLFFFDDLKNNPKEFLKNIVQFIGGDVSNVEKINTNKKVNVSIKKTIPEVHLNFLKDNYKEDMLVLADKYEGHCREWYNSYFKN